MSIRKGNKIIAGSGGGGNGESITNQNTASTITQFYDWIGTLEEYEEQQVAELHPTWVCFILDDVKDLNYQYTNRNVGDIFFTTRLDEELNGAVECDGSIYSFEDFDGKESIGRLLINEKLPYVSLTEYATLLETNGVVGVFGWDGGNNTNFRVPFVKDIFIETGESEELGQYIPAGLPNATGTLSDQIIWGNGNATGIMKKVSSGSNFGHAAGDYDHIGQYELSLSNSNDIYGNSDTVQPKAIKYRAMVQISTGFADEAVENCERMKSTVENLDEHAVRDTDLATLLDTIYPVGSVYIGTQSTCPMSTVISGSTWELVNSGKALWTSDGTNAGTTINAGLPNIQGTIYYTKDTSYSSSPTLISSWTQEQSGDGNQPGIQGSMSTQRSGYGTFDASKNGTDTIYGKSSTVQPPAYVVNVWKRTV